ncbi:predicted protein [Sclerotinia sclerotiorum 1980 UF-70]|uniref:Uncharacterized protein n=1 Tax=Sclerotinia sclerotiorum (strain ATCC 18683 / 1980 / Ss-1) TaxID=665079 RepID=A7EJP0_SCLS1|nr:predicted protein [Sclerotinia sclerotiorum 1980 UF-70]EDO03056.1 predicted protein [Sclerotinia sclerotiorum 1980 UF-70]
MCGADQLRPATGQGQPARWPTAYACASHRPWHIRFWELERGLKGVRTTTLQTKEGQIRQRNLK